MCEYRFSAFRRKIIRHLFFQTFIGKFIRSFLKTFYCEGNLHDFFFFLVC